MEAKTYLTESQHLALMILIAFLANVRGLEIQCASDSSKTQSLFS